MAKISGLKAVVTTAAFFRPDQIPFDTSSRGGDYSYRVIPLETYLSSLHIAHRSDAFDVRGIESDKNFRPPDVKENGMSQYRSLGARFESALTVAAR